MVVVSVERAGRGLDACMGAEGGSNVRLVCAEGTGRGAMGDETVVREGFQSVGSATEDERFRKREVLIGEAGLELAAIGK